MFPFYLGIDLHLKRSYLVLIDAEGEVIDKRRLKNTEIETYISRNVPKETYEVMEATRNCPFFYDLLAKHVDRVELAHAKGVRMIAAAAVKTDQIDASVLAHLARLNALFLIRSNSPQVQPRFVGAGVKASKNRFGYVQSQCVISLEPPCFIWRSTTAPQASRSPVRAL